MVKKSMKSDMGMGDESNRKGVRVQIKFQPLQKDAAEEKGESAAYEKSEKDNPNGQPNDLDEQNMAMDKAGKPIPDHEIAAAMEHLTKAEEIKNDPHMMKALEPHIMKKHKAIRSLADLRKKAKQMLGSDRQEG